MTRPRFQRPSSHTHSRRGLAAIIALTCLSLAVVVGALLLQAGLTEQRFINRLEPLLQAEWLADAGVDRAAARLTRSPSYSGETWPIAASDLGGTQGAIVHIEVKPAPSDPETRIIHVTADLHPGDAHAVTATKEIRLLQHAKEPLAH